MAPTSRRRWVVALDAVVVVVLAGALAGLTGWLAMPTEVAPDEGPAASIPLDEGRPYVEGILGSASSASPFGARTASDRILASLLFRSLVQLGPGDTVVSDLAEHWETDETGATWTFHLRPGATWHDGVPLTADDVVFTYATLASSEYTGPGAGTWGEVQATALDPETVQIHLATPLGGFLQALTQPIAPKHMLGTVPPAMLAGHSFGRRPIGSGAFTLATFDDAHALLLPWIAEPPADDPDAEIGLDPSAGLPRPYLPGLELRFYDDAELLASDWEAGRLDAVSGLPFGRMGELAGAPGARLLQYPGTSLLGVVPNLRPGHPLFLSSAVRRALLEAIDRPAIVGGDLDGLAVVADAPIPPTSWAFDAAASGIVSFDRAAAIAGLKAAGWKQEDGGWTPKGASSPASIEVLGPEAGTAPMTWAVGAAVAEAWAAIGLTTTHTALPAADLAERIQQGDFTVAVLAVNVGLDPDLYPLLASTQTTTRRSNVLGLQDPALDALLVAARAPGALDARREAYRALQVRLAEQMYILPIAFQDEVVVLSDAVEGPATRPVSGPWDRFWDVLTWRLADGR